MLLKTIMQKILNRSVFESFSKITVMEKTMSVSRVWKNLNKNIRYLQK